MISKQKQEQLRDELLDESDEEIEALLTASRAFITIGEWRIRHEFKTIEICEQELARREALLKARDAARGVEVEEKS